MLARGRGVGEVGAPRGAIASTLQILQPPKIHFHVLPTLYFEPFADPEGLRTSFVPADKGVKLDWCQLKPSKARKGLTPEERQAAMATLGGRGGKFLYWDICTDAASAHAIHTLTTL